MDYYIFRDKIGGDIDLEYRDGPFDDLRQAKDLLSFLEKDFKGNRPEYHYYIATLGPEIKAKR